VNNERRRRVSMRNTYLRPRVTATWTIPTVVCCTAFIVRGCLLRILETLTARLFFAVSKPLEPRWGLDPRSEVSASQVVSSERSPRPTTTFLSTSAHAGGGDINDGMCAGYSNYASGLQPVPTSQL